jgi:hypothetical protein
MSKLLIRVQYFWINMKWLIKFFYRTLKLIFILPRILILGPFYDILIFFATRSTRRRFKHRLPSIKRIYFYGAKCLDPKLLAIWYIVSTNKELHEAKQNGFENEVIEVTKKLLTRFRYPKRAIPEVHIGLVSMEKIYLAGGYFQYFK